MNQFKKFLDLRIAYSERELNLGDNIFIGTETYFPGKVYHLDYKTGYLRYLNKDNTDGLDFWFYYDKHSNLKPLHINMVEMECVESAEGDEINNSNIIISDYNKLVPGHDEPIQPLISGFCPEVELKDLLSSKGITLSK